MDSELFLYIEKFGYLAIFGLVFLQEIGIPNPVPNEIILTFSGYLASIGQLDLTLVILTVIAADFIGTSVLYFVFYLFGHIIIAKKPRWLPLREEQIEKLTNMISKRDMWGIFIGRLLPYVRGYTSIAAGLMQFKPKVFLPMVLLSALIWSGGYALVGKLLGPRWAKVIDAVGGTTNFFLITLGIVFAVFALRHVWKHYKKVKINGLTQQ